MLSALTCFMHLLQILNSIMEERLVPKPRNVPNLMYFLQVEEASSVLRAQLSKVIELMREVYSDRVVVMSATVEESKQLSRRARSILQAAEVSSAESGK